MRHVDTLIVGGGHAGLAMSRCLTDCGRDHVVVERGRVAERWRSERWDSLRLLTPNWMSRLPGWSYRGPDPDGYMTAGEVAAYLDDYAGSFDAPVEHDTSVEAVERVGDGYMVSTDRGTWRAASVVVASGHCDRPNVPALAAQLSSSVHQLTSSAYRNASDVPDGGVLVVGAAATGVQLADELARAGRYVVLAVGGHRRLPRRYRGMDIWWWLEQLGFLDRTIDDVEDPERARREPSLQLVGRSGDESVDLAALAARGVRLAGRLEAARGHVVHFADDLGASVGSADAHLRRVLARIDAYIDAAELAAEVLDREPIEPVRADGLHGRFDLRAHGIATVVWATGFRREYPWLRVPVLDDRGEIRHRRGVTPAPGLYVLGLRFQHRRDSNFIDGVRHDAAFLAEHIAALSPLEIR